MNVGGVQHAAALGVPLVAWSSDYVFDGTKREPYVESDPPSPLGAYGRTKLHGEAAAGEQAWIVRTSWLFGPTSKNFLRTMLRLGAERDEVAVVDDQRGCPTYVGHLAEATHACSSCPTASTTSPQQATARGPTSPRRSSRRRAFSTRVRRITTAEFGARAPRPAYSVLRSETGAPELPHWREGLRACLATRLRTRGSLPRMQRARHRRRGLHRLAVRPAPRRSAATRSRPRQAHLRRQPRQPRRRRARLPPGRHRRPGRRRARGERLRCDRQLRGRDARRPLDPRAGRVHPHRRARHAGAARLRAPPPAFVTCRSRPTRSTATSRSTRPRAPRTRRSARRARTRRRRPAATCRCSPTCAPTASMR